MPHILQNNNLEIHIDLPEEGYCFSRFDWTGKIAQVRFKNIPLSTSERANEVNDAIFGKGFYNEFGIDRAIGFEETQMGEWFHKIGVGLLQKETEDYQFHIKHNIKPAKFQVTTEQDKIVIRCISELVNGYSYVLKKEIELLESGFEINYELKNTGEKDIVTSEYVHNFMAINNELMGSVYVLKFPFPLQPDLFKEALNTEGKVILKSNEISFDGTPNEQFFFSHLAGDKSVAAAWELIHLQSKIGVSETANFKTNKINLWGWKHVISPELFFDIHIHPGQSSQWSRSYKIFDLK